MAFPAGMLKYRYNLQKQVAGSASASGEVPVSWQTEARFWGGREFDKHIDEQRIAEHMMSQESELVKARFHTGVTTEKRLLRRRDASTITAGINASVTTIAIASALRFDGQNLDYLLIDSEIVRVTAGSSGTTLTVERGALGTTAATHSINAVCVRVEKLEIIAVERADEREDELVLRVKRNG